MIPATEELRGLTFLEPPKISVITSDELSARVIAQVEEGFADIDADNAFYQLLGLVPNDFDLRGTITALYGEQVSGYYDGDTKELVVTARQDSFSPVEEVTIAHELTHALTDQLHNFNDHFNALFDAKQFDQFSAFQGFIEGDATLAGFIYAQQLSPTEQQQYLDEIFSIDRAVFDRTPKFLQDSLEFPYDDGVAFTANLYEAGGFGTVDQAYGDPPVSTEQIIHPASYGRDEPQVVPLEENILPGYDVTYSTTWGELGFRMMFDQILGGAEDASAGWGGDSYNLYFNGTDVVWVLLYQGDSPRDVTELQSAMTDYLQVGMDLTDGTANGNGQSYVGEKYAFLSITGDQLLFVAASDPAAGVTARNWFPGF